MTRATSRPLRRRVTVVAAAVPLLLALSAAHAHAAGQLVEVSGDFVPDGADVTVTLDYVVAAEEEAVETIPLSALHFGGASVTAVEASTSDGEQIQVATDEGTGKTTAELTPPAPIQPGEELRFTVSYQAAGVVTTRDDETDVVEIPVLAVTWAPAETRSGVFTATLTLPPGGHFAEGFPSVPASIDDSGTAEVVSYDMIVMPALLRAVATAGPAPFFTFQRTLEVIAVLIVLGATAALYYGTVVRPRRQRDDDEPAPDRVPA